MTRMMMPIETTKGVLPESKREIVLRPILVREEQILIMGSASEDRREFLTVLMQVMDNCIQNGLKSSEMSVVDFFWTYIKLREISKTSYIETRMACPKCAEEGGENHKPKWEPQRFDMWDVFKYETKDAMSKTIKISESYALGVRDFTVMDFFEISLESLSNVRTIAYKIIVRLLERVMVDDESIPVENMDKAAEIIDNLRTSDFNKIVNWAMGFNSVWFEFSYTCKNKHKNTIKDNNIFDFFDLVSIMD